jgi:hypothetical protein
MWRAKRRHFLLGLVAAVAACASPASAQALRPDQAFQSLKALVGDWQGRTAAGRTFLVSYRLIANDSVLVESWTMSPTRTSMTVYHMDGDALIATHYCPQGNQPRLQYRPEFSSERLTSARVLDRDRAQRERIHARRNLSRKRRSRQRDGDLHAHPATNEQSLTSQAVLTSRGAFLCGLGFRLRRRRNSRAEREFLNSRQIESSSMGAA